MLPQSEITFFAKTNFRNQERVFGIKTDDRRRHMYVIGKTGMGKTNLLENLAIQDIQKGHGIAFIDPHGDTAEKLIKAIPANRINDIIYFNPADQDFPIAFNVLEKVDSEYRHLVASGLVGVFKKIWADSWGPRLEYILRNAIMALLEYPGSTLLGVTRILVDKSYRDRVIEKVTDPVIKSFWVDEFSKWEQRTLQEVISPIQNKVGQFLSSSLIRNIVGQTVSTFDVREAMDSQKIIIMNFSKGRIGEDNSALLGAMMITKIQLAAMGRVDIPEETRKDFYLYVDEFQNFATESFANILSEARKYHLNLILANQYVNQIDERVRDAIFGNAGSIVSFRVGATDAEFLEKEFEPVFTANDIVNLPKFNVYLKLMIDGIAGDAFSATTLPPIKLEDVANEEKIIRISRERYSNSRADVEEKIRRWTGMLSEEEKAALRQSIAEPVRIQQPAPAPARTQAAPQRVQLKSQQKSQPRSQERVQPKKTAPQKPATQSVQQAPRVTPLPALVAAPVAPVEELKEATPVAPVVVAVPVAAQEPVVVAPVDAPAPAEKVLYDTLCVTCEKPIQVPFKPDGSRPTFCKDCLKDYQRAVAKERQALEQKAAAASAPASRGPAVFAPKQAPMKLGQMQYVAPKKFQPLRGKQDRDTQAVRDMVQSIRPSSHSEE
jgi:CxxC-x17-CxxC domain-containing protein